MYNWALEMDWPELEYNPASGITNPDPGQVVTRSLSDDEIRTFWRWLVTHPRLERSTKEVFKGILLTALRPGEVLFTEASEVRGEWLHVQAKRMKNRKPHLVYLSPTARSVFSRCDRFGWPLVFPFPAAATALCMSLRRGFDHKTHRLECAPFTPKDLRRTVATNLGEMGYSMAQVGMILSHTDSSVTAVYNLAQQRELRREMLQAWERRLLEIVK